MKIGITGSDGFIGRRLNEKLKKDHEVYSFDHSKGDDILDTKKVEAFVKDKDCIIHLAGLNRADSLDILKVNTIGTKILMEAIKNVSPQAKILFASSFQVYKPAKEKINEEKTEPETEYGLSKYFAEKIIEYYIKNYNIKATILRLSNVYGPGCRPNYNSVVSTFIHKIQSKEKLVVSNVNDSRDFIFVDDVVDAFSKCVNYGKKFEIFNVCNGKLTSLGELINILKKFQNFEVEDLKKNQSDFVLGDFDKIKKELNFKPNIEIERGIEITWNWFKNEYKNN